MKSGGGSDTKNKIGVQGDCGGDDKVSSAGKRGGSSIIASSLSPQKKKKTYRQFFGKRQLKLSYLSLFFPESPSCQETSKLMSIRTASDASSSTQSLNMFLLRSMKTLKTGGGQKNVPAWAFFRGVRNLPALNMLCGTIVPYVILRSHSVFNKE